jgi:hypothetical protein
MAQKNDQPPASPTLIPALPSPIPPTTSSAATSEELSFFDRAKKFISNKNTFNEFLKLCNLFSQDLVDRTVLVHRARSFIGTSPELMKWFQDFIGYDEKDVIVENKARIPGGRVSLSNCRGLGPSYRLLPKRVCCIFSFFSLSRVPIVPDDVRLRLGSTLDLAWRRLLFIEPFDNPLHTTLDNIFLDNISPAAFCFDLSSNTAGPNPLRGRLSHIIIRLVRQYHLEALKWYSPPETQ